MVCTRRAICSHSKPFYHDIVDASLSLYSANILTVNSGIGEECGSARLVSPAGCNASLEVVLSQGRGLLQLSSICQQCLQGTRRQHADSFVAHLAQALQQLAVQSAGFPQITVVQIGVSASIITCCESHLRMLWMPNAAGNIRNFGSGVNVDGRHRTCRTSPLLERS